MTIWRQSRKDILDLRRCGAIVTVVGLDHRDYEATWRWVRRQRGFKGDRDGTPPVLEWHGPDGRVVICPVVWPEENLSETR